MIIRVAAATVWLVLAIGCSSEGTDETAQPLADSAHSHYHVHAVDATHDHNHKKFQTGGHQHDHRHAESVQDVGS